MSQIALGFSIDVRVSIFTSGMAVPLASCFWTSSAYQVWKCHFISSLRGLLTETSRGCSLVVQLAGTLIWSIFFSRSSRSAGVCWPLKTWMILFKAHHFPLFLNKWKQNFICIPHHCSFIRPVICECHISHSGRNSIAGWHLSVLPW